ncbi:MAG: sigma-54-dependent Fis family transcriptional regulator [Planctomycetes bacterium]|nr:sigma-54-dependent Fis family transcriptional regulator [Planctomycetota bacterium]
MPILRSDDLAFAKHLQAIARVNPFLPARIELERQALGQDYTEIGSAKAFEPGEGPNPNMQPLLAKSRRVLEELQGKASKTKVRVSQADRTAAGHLALYALYHGHVPGLLALAHKATGGATKRIKVSWYAAFERDVEALLVLQGERLRPEETAPRLLALFFQMARAFVNIYAKFVGRSTAAVTLRASMWESIFTHDMERYRRALLRADEASDGGSTVSLTSDIPTLITGPSGTGKELVAQAVGRSGFVPFNKKAQSFDLDSSALFLPIHLAALSPSLIESELFGHRRGAFTGALEDRASFLELCASYGSVFMDEIAEIDGTLQVKLLRVLQTREFARLGDSETRRFSGRLISATNRDLAAEIETGRFREDLYFRLNADRLVTPSLRELLQGSSVELEHLLGYVAGKLLASGLGDDAEAKSFATELCTWIEANLGLDYGWPGNFRELEQCARAFLVRGRYQPQEGARKAKTGQLGDLIQGNQITADELLSRYCAQVFDEVGTYEGAARKLGLDRRTVRARVLAAGELGT